LVLASTLRERRGDTVNPLCYRLFSNLLEKCLNYSADNFIVFEETMLTILSTIFLLVYYKMIVFVCLVPDNIIDLIAD
jgi:hypothetical protein